MFLTLEEFLNHFPVIAISREAFIQQFVVTYAGHPTLIIYLDVWDPSLKVEMILD